MTWLHVSNVATVSTTFLVVVLVVATTSRLWVAVSTSLAAVLCFNYFFLPPVGTWTIADPQNWVAQADVGVGQPFPRAIGGGLLADLVRDRTQALQQNIRLAESLGATVVRVKAARPSDGLIAFAQREGVTHVIFGQSARSRWEVIWRGSTLDMFLGSVPDAAVQVVPLNDV